MRVRLSELELADLGEEIWTELGPRAVSALDKSVDRILDRARVNLNRPGSRYTASAPGESPEMDSGRLSRTLRPGRLRVTKNSYSREYGSDDPVAGLHEFGGTAGKAGSKPRVYPPRPFLRPAEDSTAAEVESLLENI